MLNKIYITGAGAISPQPTSVPSGFPDEIRNTIGDHLRCIEPNYRDYVAGDMVRRMSRLIKMGIAAAKMAAGPDTQPDAIVTGTGLGCIEDTEKFLTNMIRNNEEFLTPTSFIQSTHNTVSAQIALLMKCHAYNFTYVHRAFSFESALLDTMLQLHDAPEKKILLGGMDELTPNTLQILTRIGQVRKNPVPNLELLTDPQRGTLPGEGATFFLVTGKPCKSSLSSVESLRMVYRPENSGDVKQQLSEMLSEQGLNLSDVDLILTGMNGDIKQDIVYHKLTETIPVSCGIAAFKPLCGEYFTASAFGIWLATTILRTQSVPSAVQLRSYGGSSIRRILLYNTCQGSEHTFILINRV